MKIKQPRKNTQMKSPVEFFLGLIPDHTHPEYALMTLYPLTLAMAVFSCLFYYSFFIDLGTQPISLGENTYELLKISK